MANNYANSPKQSKFLEGWMEHKSVDSKWAKYWCVMSGSSIHIFNNPKQSKETHVGSIDIGRGARLVKREGDEKNGYKFDLYTMKKVNKFKTSKFSERELWRAFIEGITSGSIPDNIDLLPGQINDVQLSLNEYYKIQKLIKRPLPIPSEPPIEENYEPGFDTPNTSTSGSFPACDDDYMEPLPVNNYQKLIFYPDSRKTEIPSWFFPNCTRELAIQILERGAKYGNTLMRESTSDSKNLVISKRMESNGGKTETHYVVNRLSNGYKIDVENLHEPMKSLYEVMEFFIDTSGRSVTFPMTCNDLTKFGITEKIYNHYNTKIVKVLYDADSGEETLDAPDPKMSVPPQSAPIPCKGRSQSVPDIGHQAGLKFQTLSIANGLSNCDPPYMNVNQKITSLDQGKKSLLQAVSPPLPGNHPKLQPPPLPPNHPPPLKQSASFDSPAESKRNPPKHSLSLGSMDSQNRKQNLRLSQPIKVAPDVAPAAMVHEISSNKTSNLSSPISDEPNKEMFKKRLEGLLGPSPRLSGASLSQSVSQLPTTNGGTGYTSSNEHYQNIPSAQSQMNLRK
ncbi:uncharacterized protein LOC106078511 isoform X3 [Biomphalaria glabrata]|uniref:Uncharacterized protein LOC106078511 isoform X3 n=1 Tax=Biomphalaria glabrata TaxID=6526 RepID=A0A9W2ZSM0_BIOGL|nr:uncharacterized protein LOC106078511 isoform X3 [Biomphalaria glabrata]